MAQKKQDFNESPLLLDVSDLETAIRKLEQTNSELKRMIDAGEVPEDEVSELRLCIVENEFAIDAKFRTRKEILGSLGLDSRINEFKLQEPTSSEEERTEYQAPAERRMVLLQSDGNEQTVPAQGDEAEGIML